MFWLTGAVNCANPMHLDQFRMSGPRKRLHQKAPPPFYPTPPPPPYSSTFNPAPINTPPAAPYPISPSQPQTSSATVCLGLAPCVCTPSNGSANLARPLYFLILAFFVTAILCLK
ncbi:hypothetical protein GPALN_003500 [Globodera pallida]|nr:hypothetical protein GPALN_003500 [Globodera pallida]